MHTPYTAHTPHRTHTMHTPYTAQHHAQTTPYTAHTPHTLCTHHTQHTHHAQTTHHTQHTHHTHYAHTIHSTHTAQNTLCRHHTPYTQHTHHHTDHTHHAYTTYTDHTHHTPYTLHTHHTIQTTPYIITVNSPSTCPLLIQYRDGHFPIAIHTFVRGGIQTIKTAMASVSLRGPANISLHEECWGFAIVGVNNHVERHILHVKMHEMITWKCLSQTQGDSYFRWGSAVAMTFEDSQVVSAVFVGRSERAAPVLFPRCPPCQSRSCQTWCQFALRPPRPPRCPP